MFNSGFTEVSVFQVDCLLCSVSPDMNLTRSAICKSLVQHGGSSIQVNKYCNTYSDHLVSSFDAYSPASMKTIKIKVFNADDISYTPSKFKEGI